MYIRVQFASMDYDRYSSRRTRDNEVQDVYIAVMGVTGAGKSSFITTCSGKPVKIGHGLESCTSDVEEISFMYNRYVRVHLIDTPGFDDTNRAGIRLSGIIYLHKISDVRMTGSTRRNLVMFKKLCGENAFQSVVLATSMWSRVSESEGQERERELVGTDTFWGLMCKKGSRVFRYLNTRQSWLALLDYILSLNREITLEIQDEIVNQGHEIDETAAAHELNAEIIRERNKHIAELAAAKEEMYQAMTDRDEELQLFYKDQINDLHDKIRNAAAEQQKLTQTLEEVDRRKEEEFRVFREQIMRESEQERERHTRERQEYREKMARQEETILRQQQAEERRMREYRASRMEMERSRRDFKRVVDEQRLQHEVRMREIDENHRRAMADLQERLERKPKRSFWRRLGSAVTDVVGVLLGKY
ncbi:G domain-containing protein (Fragment) [Madurella fahalii]|uniref:G domain-containing protein n=1 Tax=Madurella fahalii TaxID=1157608 RepID=A0ABQ0G7F5_9PEZI